MSLSQSFSRSHSFVLLVLLLKILNILILLHSGQKSRCGILVHLHKLFSPELLQLSLWILVHCVPEVLGLMHGLGWVLEYLALVGEA